MKYDGIWIAAINYESVSASPLLFSRSGKAKSVPAIQTMELPPKTILVGELAYGSQDACKRREEVGHDFMNVIDILQLSGQNIANMSRPSRQEALDEFFASNPRYTDFYLRAPSWRSDFVRHYKESSEGLILKPVNDPFYQMDGGKVDHWLKAKKCMTSEYVVLDWELSEAKTKVDEPMAKHIMCGGYVPSSGVDSSYIYDTVTLPNSTELSLIHLVNVGSMTHEMSKSVAQNFSTWDRKVIEVGHFQLFDSGACRHPFIMQDNNGIAKIRSDKFPIVYFEFSQEDT